VALVLRQGARGIELLFIRRADDPRDPWSGQMAFPGGRQEADDPDLLSTAVRETQEEIGLRLAPDAVLGALDEVRAMARLRPVDLVIAPFVFRVPESSRATPRDEVRSIHWLLLDDLLDPRFRSTVDYPEPSGTLEFPCLRIDGLVIWGLTYRMLTGLGERLAGEPHPGLSSSGSCA
jgi:8-oxo-dGTP pyrophosphatase MutT (NUDIX family)